MLLFTAMGFYLFAKTFTLSEIASSGIPPIVFLPGIFIGFVFILTFKFRKSPFDISTSHHAHQELVKGLTTEFSGPALAIIEMTHWYESIFILGLMFLFFKQNIIAGLLISALTYVLLIIIDNISARLTWQWLLKTTWSLILGLSIINILGIYILERGL
jgi:ech hydrogenase subunit B